jgi:thioredoxin-like negative regulator of GroEL
MEAVEIKSEQEWKSLMQQAPSATYVLDFWAPWSAPSVDMNDVFRLLAKQHASKSFRFVVIEAEAVPDVAEHFDIVAVPTFIVVHDGRVLARVEGAHAAELTQTVETQSKVAAEMKGIRVLETLPSAQQQQLPLEDRLRQLTTMSDVVLFMKGIY